MFLSSKLNMGAGVPTPVDAQFNYVTMLLHGDGTNGGQNNTFLDSSTNNFTITRNGNTTQGSFSPYGLNWSNGFGSGNSIYISTGSVFSFTGNFTVEAWVFLNNTTTSGGFDPRLINIGGGIDILFVDSTKAVQVKNNGTTVLTSSSSAISLNTWSHIAVVRNGSTLTIYVNGTSVGSATYSTTFSDAGDARISRLESSGNGYLDGYISNLRIVKGSAVYTGSFTPSTTPLTAITNTVLLTCQSNRFVDNSASPFTLTPGGSPSVQRFNPFGTSSAYSTSVIGGSGYFDGSGDYLSAPSTTAFAFGTSDFTVEAWIYPKAYGGSVCGPSIFGSTNGAETGYSLNLGESQDRLRIVSNASGTWTDNLVVSTGGGAPLNTWSHIAWVRNGNSMSIYKNGVSVATMTGVSTYNFTSPSNAGYIGYFFDNSNTKYFTGNISDLRVVKGTAVYTSNFTPPTAPVSAITNTQLLNNMTNAAIFDNAMITNVETVGNAQISTSVVKFGTGSIYNPATVSGSGLKCYLGVNGTITGNYTLEWWTYHTNLNTGINHVMIGPWGSQYLVRVDNGTSYEIYIANANRLTIAASTAGIVASTWQHYAITRSGSNNYAFINGVQVGTWTQTGTVDLSTLSVAAENAGTSAVGDQLNGYMDDIRVTNGYARYTATFTPPTAAFPNTGPN